MKILDLKDLQCPMPILKTKQALQKMQSGDEIQVITTDPHSEIDFKAFLSKTSDELLKFWIENNQYFFLIKKK
ncbi:sulfurtransferase TusA family protein [Wohlfahrtiimonas larvae]|uniref:Sulfurtransferase TusA family protein n=1 Tax=Wohlfahrtiimonas larvae TaxID=1157986 RepID=A0ABP9MVK7_9GAMM|nr:sulfurtransferase TusA family protein [Wohlfahrtiimonas larvae]